MTLQELRIYNKEICDELSKENIIPRDNWDYTISTRVCISFMGEHFSFIGLLGKYIHGSIYYYPTNLQKREYEISKISCKYMFSNNLFFLSYKNKIIPLDHKIINNNPYPIIPQFIFDIQTNLINVENQKKRNKACNKVSDNLNIIALSGELLLFGISNEVTIKDDILFIHNFGKAYLRIRKDKSNYSLSITNSTETNSYIKIDTYSKDVLFEKIKCLAALNS